MPRLTARVYSLHDQEMSRAQKNAISEGLDIVGQHLGSIAITRFSKVALPTRNGSINPFKVGYKQLDPQTDLHMFFASFDLVNKKIPSYVEHLGLAFKGSGVSYIKPGKSPTSTALTAAHETAHSLGYVLPDSPQTIRADGAHCSDSLCLMHEYSGHEMDLQSDRDEFCAPCRADIRDTAEENIMQLRRARLLTGAVTGFDRIDNRG